MTSRVWYLLASGLIVSAVALAVIGVTQFLATVEGMQRVVMPGKAPVILPLGTTTLYVESRSVVDGKELVVVSDSLEFRCGVVDAAGREVPIERTTSSVTYSAGDFAGQNMFDVEITSDGEHTLICESENRFVIALGRGVGRWIVIAAVGLVPAAIGLIMFIVVLIKRRRQKRRGVPD